LWTSSNIIFQSEMSTICFWSIWLNSSMIQIPLLLWAKVFIIFRKIKTNFILSWYNFPHWKIGWDVSELAENFESWGWEVGENQ
jgi:hypothetical protein